MKHLTFRSLSVCCLIYLASCSKSDNSNVSKPQIQVGQLVSTSAPLSGSIKGTMQANQTYTVAGDITINAGDTLFIQKGVTVNVTNSAAIIVKGMLVSQGTKDAPVT